MLVTDKSSNPLTFRRWSVPLSLSIWCPSCILPSSTSGKPYSVFTGLVIKCDDLTLEGFVAGYGQILQSRNLPEMERSARLKHLVSLVYFAKKYEWQAVLSFHGAVLLEMSEAFSSGAIPCFIKRAVLSTGILRRPNHLPVEDLPRPPPQSCIVEIFNGNSVLLIKHIMATFAARESGCGIAGYSLVHFF